MLRYLIVLILICCVCGVESIRTRPTRGIRASCVNLGQAQSFGLLADVSINNTGPSSIVGNIGASSSSYILGFPPGLVKGAIQSPIVVKQAQLVLDQAWMNISSLIPTLVIVGDI